MDEVWLFNITSASSCRSRAAPAPRPPGGPANRLFLEPSTALVPRQTIRIGFAADGPDAFYPNSATRAVQSWQQPQLAPDVVNVHTVITNAQDASVTLRHSPRWGLNAAS